MINALELTPKQKEAFQRFKLALKDFRKAGGMLIGSNDCQYAVNGRNVIKHCDSYSNYPAEGTAILLEDSGCDSAKIGDPYSDASPWVVVRTKK